MAPVHRPRLLVVGESQRPTGHARHATGLLSALTDRWDIHQFEVADPGGPGVRRPWTVHRRSVPGDRYGLTEVPRLVAALEPRALLFLHDSHVLGIHSPWLAEAGLAGAGGRRPAIVAAVQIERLADVPDTLPLITAADRIVVPHEPACRAITAAGGGPVVHTIPHGLDPADFRPYGRQRARRLLFPDRPDLADAFVVLNANRNTARKRVDRTLAGFAQFVRSGRHGNARLLLHMGGRDHGCAVLDTAHRLGIADRTILTTAEDGPPQLPDETLRLIYNAADVGVNTADGESWGFVGFEHAATGAAQVVPGHAGQAAIWGDDAIHLSVDSDEAMCEDLARALDRLATDPPACAAYGRRAYRRASDPGLRWDVVADRWHDALRAAIADRTRTDPHAPRNLTKSHVP